jgi:hypothetical protein
MSGPAWAAVHAGLLTLLPSLPAFANVPVYDGAPVTNDNPTAWVTVGWLDADQAGSYAMERDPSGFGTLEIGDVVCHLASNAGDTDPSVARNAAFALVSAWQHAHENDQTLGGVLTVGSVLTLSTQIVGRQNGQGSATELLVSVHYQTVTYYTP